MHISKTFALNYIYICNSSQTSDTIDIYTQIAIYTFKDNAIKEVAYDLSAGIRYSHDRVMDEYVSAGGRYLIYKGKGNTR